MKRSQWSKLDDESLEKLLAERWASRGVILAAMFAAAVATTYLGMRQGGTFADRLVVGALLVTALVAGATAFSMRLTDLRIHRELQRRRKTPRAR